MDATSFRRYALAVLVVGAAALVRALGEAWLLGQAPFATFFLAIIAIAWFLGTGPALFGTLASLAAAWAVVHPEPGVAASALFLVVGSVLALFGGAWRVALRSLAESATQARLREQRFAVTLASIGDAVITTDPEGRVTYLNPVARSLTGWSLDEATGRPLENVFRIVNEHSRAPVVNPVREVLRRGEIVGLANHTVLIARDGTEFAIDDSAAPIRADDGPASGVVLIFRDVTERRRAESERAQLAAIVNHSEDAIFSTSLAGEIQSWNAGAERLYGYPDKEVVGRSVTALVPPGRRTEIEEWLHRLRSGTTMEHVETQALRKDGSRAEVSLGLSPIFDPQGDRIGVAAVVRDITARKQAEQALRRSEQELSDFFENAAMGLHWVGPDGMILRANRAELAMLGYAEHEYVGRYIAEFHVDREASLDILSRLAAGETLHDHPARMWRKDGSIAEVRIDSSVYFEEGRFIHTRCFTRDVTAEIHAQQVLRQSEERLRLALEAGQMGTWEWDPSSGRVTWSAQLEGIHGLAPGTFPGTFDAFQSDIHPEDRDRVLATVQATLEAGSDHRIDYRIVRPDGAIRWVEGRGKLYRDEGRSGPRMVGVCVDVTERMRDERAARFLARASAELANLVDYESTLEKIAQLAVPEFADWCAVDLAQPDGSLRRLAVAHVDPSKVALAREIYERYPAPPDRTVGPAHVLGTGQPEIIEEISDELLVENTHDAEHLELARELGLRSYMGVPLRAQRRTLGVLTFVAAESGRRYDAHDLELAGDLGRRAALAIESSELYGQLRERDRRKDEFLATLSHELRNPLAPIRHAVEIIRLAPGDAATRERALGLLDRQVKQLVRLVDDLLEVSRITLGKVELRRERIPLSAILQSALETSRPLIEASQHALTVRLPESSVELDADLTRLAQVFSNLLANASKYTAPGGRIEVDADVQDGHVSVRVRDDGVGIPAEVLPTIFEMFTQAASSRDRTQGGLGIGLALVRGLVELHGGEVHARSDGPGQGSEFLVRLPVAAESGAGTVARVRAGAEPDATPRPRRILVVDDNVDAAFTLRTLLEMQGHAVRSAHDGFEALDAIADFEPELVLLDIGLPGLTGYEVAERVRAGIGPQPVLVAVTGWGQEQDRRRSRDAGFHHHFAKPVRLNELNEVLRAIDVREGGEDAPR